MLVWEATLGTGTTPLLETHSFWSPPVIQAIMCHTSHWSVLAKSDWWWSPYSRSCSYNCDTSHVWLWATDIVRPDHLTNYSWLRSSLKLASLSRLETVVVHLTIPWLLVTSPTSYRCDVTGEEHISVNVNGYDFLKIVFQYLLLFFC